MNYYEWCKGDKIEELAPGVCLRMHGRMGYGHIGIPAIQEAWMLASVSHAPAAQDRTAQDVYGRDWEDYAESPDTIVEKAHEEQWYAGGHYIGSYGATAREAAVGWIKQYVAWVDAHMACAVYLRAVK